MRELEKEKTAGLRMAEEVNWRAARATEILAAMVKFVKLFVGVVCFFVFGERSLLRS